MNDQENEGVGPIYDGAPLEEFDLFSNPLDWRPIDRFIFLGALVMLAPVFFLSALLMAMRLSPSYIAEDVGGFLLVFYLTHIIFLGTYLLIALRRRKSVSDWSAFETFIIISFTVNVLVSSYATGTHFTEGLLLLFLGVNITSALANIRKIRIFYFFVCATMALFALNDFAGTFDAAPLFKLSPLKVDGSPFMGWLSIQVIIAAALLALVYVCTAAISRWVERESLYREMSTVDGLTRLTNRRSLIERGEKELARLQRFSDSSEAGFACIMVDLDHFKRINDTWGHHAGDAVLVAVSAIMMEGARQYDEVGRYGGEEFAILLPGVTSEEAMIVAERIRQKIAAAEIEVDGQVIPVSASFGVACYPALGLEGLNDLLKAADAALYDAKASGRNRAVLAK